MHTPVMLQESVEALAIHPQGIYVDLTFGGGGHAQAILRHLQQGRLFAFDQDPKAEEVASQFPHASFTFIRANARFMQQFLAFHGVHRVDGILADLGVSSYQIDTAARGFSTRYDGPLDMRMDPQNPLTARDILRDYTASQLQQLLQYYGEVRNARTLARAIVASRATSPMSTTGDLRLFLQQWAPRHGAYKYYAQVFQALRIAVNDELGALKEILRKSVLLLRPQGRLVILSYHSLEDRLVKRFMAAGNFEGVLQKDSYGNVLLPIEPLHRKPLVPSSSEIRINNRARSAKLRVGRVVGGIV